MTVTVYCDECSDRQDSDEELPPIEMIPYGLLYTNEFKTQTQEYECVICKSHVTVSINTLE